LFSSALNINIYTSILPSHTHFDNGETQIKRVTSRSFVPTIGDLSFGWNRKFWELSYVSFNIGTLRTRLTPSSSEVEKQKTQLYIEYGCSVALSIQKTLGKSISWLNKSNLYFNSLKSNQISIDNIIYITLYRNWQIQIKTILIFDQLNSTNLQLFNAMAFSCVFNNSRSIREKKTSWLIDLTF
jgi:hypothetical protein